jgi:beta-lactam-binding protein with PASTA domain
VPVGARVSCQAELVVPSIVGLDPATAAATLTAAGFSTSGLGSGIVVSQNPQAGTVVASPQSVSYYAEQPRVVAPFVGSGGGSTYYKNCDAARAAGAAPISRGAPGYRPALDRDNDGIACE